MSASTQVSNQKGLLERWLPYCRLDAIRPKLRLLCFAHAGGSALAFHKWPDKLPWNVQVCAVQLPGRERRLGEPFIKRMPELISEISAALLPRMDRPLAILGHSLGAKLAFEFVRRVRAWPGAPEVVHLFVSGCPAPHLRSSHPPIYNLPDERFLQRLSEFGGTPHEVLSNPEIMKFLAPRLRSDFELDDTYTFEPEQPLSCPISAWAGDSDDLVTPDSLEAWREHTRGEFTSQILKGTHFALYEQETEVLRQIRRALSSFT
ncbi:MAG TPA: alpha/beta fold hydrolase [Candidatus Solibacter sp.]|jgi:medium-chain acyl-[acyl-carrier-protein] hydrolase|nr:alpha/beta fold hydrolase [Candidatus Solibacter sp.]